MSPTPGAAVAETARAPSPDVVIPIQWTRGTRAAITQGHLGAGVLLFAFGLSGLLNPHHHLAMSVASVLVAGSYLVFVAREFRRIKRNIQGHDRIGWVEILAGLVVLVESIERLKPGRIFQAATAAMFPALVLIGLGLFEKRVDAAFRFAADGRGFKLRLSPLRMSSFRWDELADFRVSPNGKRFEIRCKDGRRRAISLRRVANRDEICRAIAERLPATASAEPGEVRVEQGTREASPEA